MSDVMRRQGQGVLLVYAIGTQPLTVQARWKQAVWPEGERHDSPLCLLHSIAFFGGYLMGIFLSGDPLRSYRVPA